MKHISIVYSRTPGNGIFHDALSLSNFLSAIGLDGIVYEKALDQYWLRHRGTPTINIPYVSHYPSGDESVTCNEMLSNTKGLVLIEKIDLPLCQEAQLAGIPLFIVVNLEWATYPVSDSLDNRHTSLWIKAVRDLGMICLSRTTYIHNTLVSEGLSSFLIGWSTATPISRRRSGTDLTERGLVLYLGHTRGWRERRGVDYIVDLIKSNQLGTRDNLRYFFVLPSDLRGDKTLANIDNRTISIQFTKLDDKTYWRLLSATDFILFPSRFEGYGNILSECIQAGSIPIITDSPPMNERCPNSSIRITVTGSRKIRLANASSLTRDCIFQALEEASLLFEDKDLLEKWRRDIFRSSISERVLFMRNLSIVFGGL